jgi:Carboxypeptidase regulatory-like domain
MKSATCFALILILLSAFGGAQFVFAQGTDLGTIRGVVTDPSGAVIPKAKVVILDLVTNTTRETTTNSQGEYQMFGLRSGNYKVSIGAPGMNTQDITGLVVTGSDVLSANAVLKLSGGHEQVVVVAEAPAIDTENQTISGTIAGREIVDLPRDSRDIYSFLYLNPNITQGVDAGEFKFLGFQSYGANFTIDGQRSTNTIFGSPTSNEPSLEAVAELNVLSNDFSSEYAGVQSIRVTTKRGGAGYHGSAFYNNKNSALAALQIQDKQGMRDFVPTEFLSHYPTPYFNYNDIGGSLGGPIPGLKKTWFFMAYERNYSRAPVSFTSSTLPHPSLWVGDFSPLIDPTLVNPGAYLPDVPAAVTLTLAEKAADTYLGLGQQFVTIPSRLLDPNVQQLFSKYFPKISQSVQINLTPSKVGRIKDPFQTLLPGGTTRDLGTLRVDHDFTDKDHIYVVYNPSASVGATSGVRTPFTGLGLVQNDVRDNTVAGSYVRMIHNNLINEARGGFNRENAFRHSNTTLEGFLSSIGLDSTAIDAYGAVVGAAQLKTHGHPVINYGSQFNTFDRSGNRNTDRQLGQYAMTFGDTLTWVIHNHNLKMGADFVRNVGQDGFATARGNPRGTMTYGNPTACQAATCFKAKADPLTDFLLGLAPTSVTFVPESRPVMDVHNWEQGYFFQDDWKATRSLTLNLGLRYEVVLPFVDKNDIMMNFDPTFNNNTGRFIIPTDKTTPFLDPRIATILPNAVVTAGQSGLGIGRGLVRTDKNNFAPRIGAALALGDKSVVRGGYGIYFPTAAAQGIRDPLATNAFNQALTKKDLGTPLQNWPAPLTGGDIVTLGGAPSVNAVPVGLHQPLIHQYNVTFERELGLRTSARFSYLGATARGLIAGKDLNGLKPSDVPWATTLDPTGNGGPGDGVTPCDPDNGDCEPTVAQFAMLPYPTLGDFLLSFGNFGHSQSNAFQAQVERRYNGGLMFNASYTYLDQKSTGLDTGNSSLGGVAYNPFNPEHDYGQDGWVSRHRFILYGMYDLPVGRGRKFGSSFSRWTDAVIGGWQTTFQMFAKTGTGFTPYWTCDNCFNSDRYVGPGNIGTSSVDAVGDFTGGYRPLVVGDYKHHVADQIYDPAAFGLPPLGADVFDNPQVAKRNLLWGPGAWGVNFGLHKDFKFGDRVTANLGADCDNVFNHPLRAPNSDGGSTFSNLGSFSVAVDPATLALKYSDAGLSPNSDFARPFQTFSQEGVDSRRTIRIRLRITF